MKVLSGKSFWRMAGTGVAFAASWKLGTMWVEEQEPLPIVLCHGFLGFDRLLSRDYFVGVAELFEVGAESIPCVCCVLFEQTLRLRDVRCW